ncbi:MAG: hypothetical protein HKN47_17115, partial [Pirellulaceae bacterium]|nr:hypothetical protein [Pirellulaceae bacterium]
MYSVNRCPEYHFVGKTFAVMMMVLVGFVGNAIGDERPNIVLIMADDMGFSDIGCYG